MLLTVRNRTLSNVVLNSELGSIGSRKTVVLDLTIDEIERSRNDLVRLSAAGVIVWSTSKTSDGSDDGAEAATIAYADASSGSAVMTPVGVQDGDFIVRDVGSWVRLPVGNDGEVLQVIGGAPVYAPASATGAPLLRGIRNFTSSDFYERAAGSALQGNTNPGFEVMLAVIIDIVEGGGFGAREIISNSFQFNPDGYMIGMDDIRPLFAITDGSSTRFGVFTGNWARARQGKVLVFLSMGYNNAASQRFFQVNGQDFLRASQTGYTANTIHPVRLGCNAVAATDSARGLTVVGYAMCTTGELTTAQRELAFRTFLATGDFPTGDFQHRFSMKTLLLGAAPSTLVDDIGGLDMTLTGSGLVVVDENYAGQAVTFPVSPDAIITLSGNFFAWTNQSIAVTGPTTISSSLVLCTTASVAPTVTTPAFPVAGVEITIADVSGNAAANNILVNANAGQLINGGASTTINTNRGYRRIVFDGTNWTIVGSA